VSTAFGLIGFVLYVVVIVGLAAGVTWVVVRLTPSKSKPKPGGSARS
jgi:hypothetical protein